MDITIGMFTFNFAWRSLLFVAEILIAEMLFLYPFERRKQFVLRYALVVLLCCVYRIIYENIHEMILGGMQILAGEALGTSLDNLFLYTSILAVTILGMRFCFKGRTDMILYACTAGYAVQHFAYKFFDIIRIILPLRTWIPDFTVRWLVFESLCHIGIYIVAYYIFARTAQKYNYKNNGDALLNILSVTIVAIGTGINRFAIDFSVRTDMQVISDSLYAMTCCAFALIIQFSLFERNLNRAELELSKSMLKEQGRQYNQWKANLETLNIKYHDLRHELNVLKDSVSEVGAASSIGRVEQLIDESFSVMHTGNEMLDVLLSSKKSICERNKIIFTCTVDSNALSQMNSVELASIFCNALDNAIDSVSKIAQEEKRVISLGIKQLGGFVDIHLQNYFDGEITFQDGLPVSMSEEDGHGFGMKSMKRTAEMLGGAMSVHVEEDLFHLQFVIPTQMDAF